MVQKRTLKKLKRRNWSEVIKYDKHPDDTLRDYKDHCNKLIYNLILFTGKLPNDAQSEIYTVDKVTNLVAQILRGNNEGLQKYNTTKRKSIINNNDEEFNLRIAQISASLVKMGVQILINYYGRTLQLDPRLHPKFLEPLHYIITVCDTILHPLTRVTKSGRTNLLFNTPQDKNKKKDKARY